MGADNYQSTFVKRHETVHRSEGINLPHGRLRRWKIASVNSRKRISVAALSLILWTTAGFAAATQPLVISDALKQAASISDTDAQAITQAVAANAAIITDGSDPTAQSAARDWLVNQTNSAGGLATANFLNTYSSIVNDQLLKVASSPNCNFRAAIEIGLAAARIDDVAHSTSFEPLAMSLLQNKSDAIAYVGMKLVHGILPAILNEATLTPADTALEDQILKTVADHPQPPLGGSIVGAAYLAMQDTVFGSNKGSPAQISLVLVPLVEKLELQRIALYSGSGPVERPQVDSSGVVILLAPEVWPQLSAGAQRDAMGLVVNLIDATSKRAVSARSSAGGNAVPLVEQLQTDGRELKIVSDPNTGSIANQTIYGAAAQLASLGSGSGPNYIANAAGSTVDAINAYRAALGQ